MYKGEARKAAVQNDLHRNKNKVKSPAADCRHSPSSRYSLLIPEPSALESVLQETHGTSQSQLGLLTTVSGRIQYFPFMSFINTHTKFELLCGHTCFVSVSGCDLHGGRDLWGASSCKSPPSPLFPAHSMCSVHICCLNK